MALSKKLVKAVKKAQKQAEATMAEVREAIDARLPEVNVDPTPFYAVVGAADRVVDTIKHAAEQLEATRQQAKVADLREGAKKEAADLQKELQERILDLQNRTAELQRLAAQLADKVLTRAQDLPAQVMNQGLVLASNAKDQFDAAADRGERVVSEIRAHGDQVADEAATRSEEAATRVKEVAGTVVDESEDLTQTIAEAVQDDAEQIKDQLKGSAQALDEAAAPEEPLSARETVTKKAPAKKAPVEKAPAKKATRKRAASAEKKATTGTSTAKKSTSKKAAPITN